MTHKGYALRRVKRPGYLYVGQHSQPWRIVTVNWPILALLFVTRARADAWLAKAREQTPANAAGMEVVRVRIEVEEGTSDGSEEQDQAAMGEAQGE